MPGTKSLLLVVDVQNGFLNNHETRRVVPMVNKLISVYEHRGWPVVCSRFVNLEGSNWERLRDWHSMKGQPDTELAPGLTTQTPYILKKSTYSAWSSETTAISLSHQVQDVVIVGVDTNECVLATALAVFDSGFTPWVVEDGCASSGGTKPHEMAITLLSALLGQQQIISSKEVL